MKVIFYGEEFKKAVDRVLPVVNKKSALPILYSVRIEAKDKKVTVSTTDTKSFASVEISADVVEPGVCYIFEEDIKKIYTLANRVSFEVSIKTNANNNKEQCFVTVANGKKKSSVSITEYTDNDNVFPGEPEEEVIKCLEQELLAAMSDLAPYTSCNDNNKLMTGYYFDGIKKRMVALDGHRVAVKSLSDFFTKECTMVIPQKVYTHLKKLIGTKSNTEIAAYADDKYIKFVGADFTYTSRLIEGEYFRVDQILVDNCDIEFYVDPKELGELAKEYKKTLKASDKSPMFMVYDHEDDKMCAGIEVSGYCTADVLENTKDLSNMGHDLVYAFNPGFISDAMQLFDEDVKCKCVYGKSACQKHPLTFCNDVYTIMVLPVNVETTKLDTFKKFVA